MLIDQLPEKNESPDKKHALVFNSSSQEIVNNSELFEIEEIKYDENTLCTRDLVILYENMDHCTKSIHISKNTIEKAPNHYVETVIYNDYLDSDVSDVSEIYSNEDVHNVIMINDERIDLLNTIPSFQPLLCHKYGGVNMETALSNEYNKHFIFNDNYIRDQLNINSMSGCKYSDSTVIPASLLDYICCKRSEENYSFYMDNVIKYVQHTIDQLKRISNGDYLTGTAKEKWREVNSIHKENKCQKNAIVSCANVPARLKRKSRHFKNTWDDKIHSEMDIRCLKKILEKRIYLQVPKILSGTYKLFRKFFDNNLTISNKKGKQLCCLKNINESPLNVVLKLQCSNSDKVEASVNSVMVLCTSLEEERNAEQCSVIEITTDYDEGAKISNIENSVNDVILKSTPSLSCYSQADFNDNIKSDESYAIEEFTEPYPIMDELSYTMRRLNMHSPVLEESEDASTKKKRASRVRIKSPYENRSYVIEEKRRRKLLEIKEKREKKKMVINENHKVTKPKYGKGAIMAHSSYSVTKLSITNKSFYNSIYGQTLDNKSLKNEVKRHKIDNISSLDLDYNNVEKHESGSIPNKASQHFISRSYYLDDADTEMMHLRGKSDSFQDAGKEIGTRSTSSISNDVDNLSIIKRLFTNASVSDLSITDTMSSFHKQMLMGASEVNKNDFLQLAQSNEALVPTNTPTKNEYKRIDKKEITTECRKNINKIYDLMKINNETDSSSLRINKNNATKTVTKQSYSTQSCDSGTSNKHQLISSNINKDMNSDLATVIPKVIINSKQRTIAVDNKVKKEVKKYDAPKIINNPLKAISQLLHDIDNVQKTRQKGGNERRSKKSENVNPENKTKVPIYKRNNDINTVRLQTHKEKISHQNLTNEKTKPAPRLSPEKLASKFYRKNVIDIMDEVKELKGEAVRGPSKRSRLDNLAQPKKTYGQAHYEQYQNRHDKQFVADRQRVSFQLPNREKLSPAALKRQKKVVDINISTLSTKQTVFDSGIEKSINSKIVYRDTLEDHEKKIPTSTKGPSSCTKTNSFLNPLNKKNVSVESYANNNHTIAPALSRNGNNEISRAPLIPVCIDLESVTSSAEGSTALGNKLHLMINSITNTNYVSNALTGTKEPIIKSDTDDKKSKTDPQLNENDMSTSDYSIDVFEDKHIVTAVACISTDNQNSEADKGPITKILTYKVKDSESELQELETALYNQISTGTFQKRLKIKKLTLTPKHSIQEAFLLNSGDTDSLLVKSTLSRKFGFNKTDMSESKPIPDLSNMIIDRTFPIQISTVGYAFLKHYDHNVSKLTGNERVHLKDKSSKLTFIDKSTSKIKELCHKSFQCNMKIQGDLELHNTDVLVTKKNYGRPESSKVDNSSDMTEGIFKDFWKFKDVSLEEKYKDNEINLKAKSDNISTSTSLDILVGLLNEIKKITSHQANFVKYRNENNLNIKNKELEVLLNNVPIQENSSDNTINSSISMTSLINKEEHPNKRPVCQNDDDINGLEVFKTRTEEVKIFDRAERICFDKELTVKMSQKEIKHAFTDVPSKFYISTVNRSTDFVNTFNSTNKHFSHSVTTLYDCSIIHLNSSTHKITELPQYNNEISHYNKTVHANGQKITKKYNSIIKKMSKTESEIVLSEFDPTMRMKRDILVTMYSILVLTIFTALTFPDLLPPA